MPPAKSLVMHLFRGKMISSVAVKGKKVAGGNLNESTYIFFVDRFTVFGLIISQTAFP